MTVWTRLGAALLALLALAANAAQAQTWPQQQMRQWVLEMREQPRGPFRRLRWFCADGTVLPPQPYACEGHGGGRQHGELNETARRIREAGFQFATVLAAADPTSLLQRGAPRLKQVLLERYLVAVDDGWIYHRARYYRGAFQVEAESAAARRILAAMLSRENFLGADYLVLTEAARLLPLDGSTADFQKIRAQASALARENPRLTPLRNKIHSQPAAEDAREALRLAEQLGQAPEVAALRELGAAIEAFYARPLSAQQLRQAAGLLGDSPLATALQQGGQQLTSAEPPQRLALTSGLMARVRGALPELQPVSRQLQALELLLALEQDVQATGNQLAGGRRSVEESLALLRAGLDASYGAGWLTPREYHQQQRALGAFDASPAGMSLLAARSELDYLGRTLDWARARARMQFGLAVEHFAALAPLVRGFGIDRLRGSPLRLVAAALDSLRQDTEHLAGVRHRVFGRVLSGGARVLTPGMARGVLRFGAGDQRTGSIHVLPETTAELPAAAGVITANHGNALSHVQLLTASLGIPNVRVQRDLLELLARHRGERVVLAASPGGVVEIHPDGDDWDRYFQPAAAAAPSDKPRLAPLPPPAAQVEILSLDELAARPRGLHAGPKATHLAQLRQRYPGRVSPALVLGYGAFRALLEAPVEAGGPSAWEWFQSQYAELPGAQGRRQNPLRALLAWMRHRVTTAPLPAELEQHLRQRLRKQFGADGAYGVFVRSDTNAEDLPGFNGAGLNRTVPNVVGEDAVLQAIRQVWASPFTERAFGWRERHLQNPTEVMVSVLLHRSVAVEKSGVLVTTDLRSDTPGGVTVVAGEGVGAGVGNEAAETLLLHPGKAEPRLLASATAPLRKVLDASGGIRQEPADGPEYLLRRGEIQALEELAASLPERFPDLLGDQPNASYDVEFGFRDGQLYLFQVRALQQAQGTAGHPYLSWLDRRGVVSAEARP